MTLDRTYRTDLTTKSWTYGPYGRTAIITLIPEQTLYADILEKITPHLIQAYNLIVSGNPCVCVVQEELDLTLIISSQDLDRPGREPILFWPTIIPDEKSLYGMKAYIVMRGTKYYVGYKDTQADAYVQRRDKNAQAISLIANIELA